MQPSRTATECEVDLVRKTTRLCDRAQTLDTEKPAGVTHARLNIMLDPSLPHVRIAQRSLALRPAHSRRHLYVTSYSRFGLAPSAQDHEVVNIGHEARAEELRSSPNICHPSTNRRM